jgi:hypothetical protein
VIISGKNIDEIWFTDFEFNGGDGQAPSPLCLVAMELISSRYIRLWRDEILTLKSAPFNTGVNSLVVSFYASAEMGCFLSLGWDFPVNLIDLYTEFRNNTNGLTLTSGRGLIGALIYHGLDCISSAEKDSMRDLILGNSSFTEDEKTKILKYCQSDVDSLKSLFGRMQSQITPHSFLRADYMKSLATMEHNGIPIDVELLTRLTSNWGVLKTSLINKVDAAYHVFDGMVFKYDKFVDYLSKNLIPWPALESGHLQLDEDTFKMMSKIYPQVHPLYELRRTLSQLRLNDLTVGSDGRNRCMLSAFSSITGRNQPSTSKFVYGLPSWLRSLIKPKPGTALAYIDWSQQEFGIAAALSRDEKMMKAYESGDPYLGFAKLVGAVPDTATKKSHPTERDRFKITTLAVQYCMTEKGLSVQQGISETEAKHLLDLHRKCFPVFWRWSDAALDYAQLNGRIHTAFDWRLHVTEKSKPRSLRNFPAQGNGAELMRLASIFGLRAGIKICCPVHDAFLIEAPLADIDAAVATMQDCMARASEVILKGFRLSSEAKIIRYPDRYEDPRGVEMWRTVTTLLDEIEPLARMQGDPLQPCESRSI